MRKYKTLYEEVDLDNPDTYKDMPQDNLACYNRMLQEIGYFYCYTQYWNKDIFSSNRDSVVKQLKRINNLIVNFTANCRKKPLIWHQEQLFLFLDEIENMC